MAKSSSLSGLEPWHTLATPDQDESTPMVQNMASLSVEPSDRAVREQINLLKSQVGSPLVLLPQVFRTAHQAIGPTIGRDQSWSLLQKSTGAIERAFLNLEHKRT